MTSCAFPSLTYVTAVLPNSVNAETSTWRWLSNLSQGGASRGRTSLSARCAYCCLIASSFSTSARSCVRPLARLFAIRSSKEITGTCRPSIETSSL
jgi:hypothetical protein